MRETDLIWFLICVLVFGLCGAVFLGTAVTMDRIARGEASIVASQH